MESGKADDRTVARDALTSITDHMGDLALIIKAKCSWISRVEYSDEPRLPNDPIKAWNVMTLTLTCELDSDPSDIVTTLNTDTAMKISHVSIRHNKTKVRYIVVPKKCAWDVLELLQEYDAEATIRRIIVRSKDKGKRRFSEKLVDFVQVPLRPEDSFCGLKDVMDTERNMGGVCAFEVEEDSGTQIYCLSFSMLENDLVTNFEHVKTFMTELSKLQFREGLSCDVDVYAPCFVPLTDVMK